MPCCTLGRRLYAIFSFENGPDAEKQEITRGIWNTKGNRQTSHLKDGKVAESLLVASGHPFALGDERSGLLVDLGLGSGNFVLYWK